MEAFLTLSALVALILLWLNRRAQATLVLTLATAALIAFAVFSTLPTLLPATHY